MAPMTRFEAGKETKKTPPLGEFANNDLGRLGLSLNIRHLHRCRQLAPGGSAYDPI